MPANSFLDAPRAYLFFNPTFLKYFDCIFTSKKINMIFNGYISTDIFQRIYFNGYISTDIWISKIHTNQSVYPSKHRFHLGYCNHRLRSCHRASNLFLQM